MAQPLDRDLLSACCGDGCPGCPVMGDRQEDRDA